MRLIPILLDSIVISYPAKSHAATSPELRLGVTAFEVGSKKMKRKMQLCHNSLAWSSSSRWQFHAEHSLSERHETTAEYMRSQVMHATCRSVL